ncbi:zinc ribbon domain-containing protein [Gluconobacter sp. P5E10]|uniref:zinc ribbon domain-containing protein n=1 Tax=Gluconobacter sp. P5E10 TaxID=2762613 RepID=UPI001C045547|nr:zinc-ribbon domain-containing protein [Gluconobacter sp. P5E10]
MICPSCAEELPQDATFCPNCGTKVASLTTSADIDVYVRGRVSQELEKKLSDQEVIVSTVADKAEDLFWKRVKRAVIVAFPLVVTIIALLSYLGFKTYGDTVGKIKTISNKAIIQVQDASKLVQAERDTISKTAAAADALKKRTDKLSKDLQSQADRITSRGGEISAKIVQFDKSEDDVQKKLQAELTRASDLSRRLDAIEKSLTASAVEVSHRADAVGIEQAFPGLGAARYVTFGGNRWSTVNAKKSNEKWIYFSIHPWVIPKLTKNQVTNAVEDMKKLGITPIYKSFGTAGPMYTALFFSKIKQEDTIYYFHRQDTALANNLSVLLSKSLGRPINAEFFDPTTDKDDAQKMILETTDLDFFYSMDP